MNILLIRRDNIGDLILTTPLIAGIKRTFPEANLLALANSYNAPVLAGNTHLEGVFAYTKLKHRLPGQSWADALFRRWLFNRWISSSRFDHVIVAAPPSDAHALSMARRTQSPLVRFVEGPTKSPDKGKVIDFKPLADLHAVAQMAALGQAIGVPIEASSGRCEVFPDAQALARARAALPSARPLIALHLSARRPDQRWPVESFAACARALHAQCGAHLLLLWSPGAQDDPKHPGDDAKALQLQALIQGIPHTAYPTPSLPDLIAALSLTDLVICADGGAMHCAAGVGKPIVALFGSSPVRLWHPWGVPYRAMQPSSHNVVDITPEEVATAVAQLISFA
jgi:heptosyltransferase III